MSILDESDLVFYTVAFKRSKSNPLRRNPLDVVSAYGKPVTCSWGNEFEVAERLRHAIDYAIDRAQDLYWLDEWREGSPECDAELDAYIKGLKYPK